MRLSQALDGYRIAALADGYSELTIIAYLSTLKLLVTHLKDPEVTDIQEKDLQEFMAWLRTQYQPRYVDYLSTASIHRYWKAIRSFFKWAGDNLNTGRPDLVLTMPKYTNAEILPYSEEEVRRLLAACEQSITVKRKNAKPYKIGLHLSIRNKAIIFLLLDTGIRPGELSRLCIDDINLNSGELIISPHHTGKTKPRVIPFEKTTSKALWRYLSTRDNPQSREPLFLTEKNRALTRHTVNSLIEHIAARARVSNPSPYRFRHTFAIQYLRNGGDVFTLQRILGHSSLSTTRKYLLLIDADAKSVHQRSSPVARWRL